MRRQDGSSIVHTQFHLFYALVQRKIEYDVELPFFRKGEEGSGILPAALFQPRCGNIQGLICPLAYVTVKAALSGGGHMIHLRLRIQPDTDIEGFQDSPEADLPTLKGWLRRLAENGPKTVVATSVPLADGQASRKPECTSVLAYERDEDRFWRVDCSYIPAYYPGTGDVFASVLTGSLLQGDSLAIALDRAVQFVTLGIRGTFGQGLPNREGILLERILDTLRAPLGSYMCRLED